MLLLDEPLGALDLKLRRQMQDELKAIQKRVGTAFIHVTHDQEEAMALADHCVVMNDGRIEDEGPPERVYARPATRFSAGFMGESTLIAGTVIEARTGRAVVETRSAASACPAHRRSAQRSRWRSGRNIFARSAQASTATVLRSATAKVSEIVFQGSFKRVLAVSATDPSIRIHRQASGRPPPFSPATSSRFLARPTTSSF